MALWVVNAAPEFSLELKSWWYPFVGQFEGRGFFNKQQAKDLANELRRQGYDVVVSGAPAYSTLGWFADPVLSTFVNFKDADLAELIFHELTHQRLYISGDTAFNESFATATAQAATMKWLAARGNEGASQEYAASVNRLDRITQKLRSTRDKLGILFSQPNESVVTQRKLKVGVYQALRAELKLLQNEPGFSVVKNRRRSPMNNATLGSAAVYHKHVPAFRKLFENCNQRFPDYFKAAGQLGKLPRAERHRALKVLRLAAP
jgi:predicted aminopeptidase